jgi:hypothetical protein
MHGTFRAHVTEGAVTTVRFNAHSVATPRRTPWRSTLAALLAGSCIAVLPGMPRPVVPAVTPPVPAKAKPALRHAAKAPSARHASRPTRRHRSAPVNIAEESHGLIQIVLPEPTPPTIDIQRPMHMTVADSPAVRPPVLPASDDPRPMHPATLMAADSPSLQPPVLPAIDNPRPARFVSLAAADVAPLPAPASHPTVVDAPAAKPAVATPAAKPLTADLPPASAPVAVPGPAPRPVDVAQISDSEVRSLNVPQLREPGLAEITAPELSARIAAMQVTPLPPVRLRDSDRAALLAEAPTRMTVRIGGTALGKVDFRMSDTRTIDVRLGNLLDVLAGHYDAAEFARLRGSAAADAFVSFDQLRALGLNLRYDPVYDELRING